MGCCGGEPKVKGEKAGESKKVSGILQEKFLDASQQGNIQGVMSCLNRGVSAGSADSVSFSP